ncbi:MAG: competence/damage-inducible protein A [Chitinophagales bacterium]|nr:competence/damage-inducible protein A [Chitinophagales bacterium]
MNASIITIGDELLIGQVVDTNSSWMGQELNKIGVYVIRKIVVGDVKRDIVDALDEAGAISDLVLITGGLGPTKDDITKHTLCDYFRGRLVFNEEVYEMVETYFARMKRPMLESNRRQAELPDNCIHIKNYNGTAPGMWFERDGKVFISMPGVPWEMKLMMQDNILARIKQKFETELIIHKTILTQGIGESFLSEHIRDIEDAFPEGIKLAYLPNLSSVRLRITARGKDESLLAEKVEMLTTQIKERLSEYIWGYDDDILEDVVGRMLISQQASLCTAESCTGGLIAHKLTSIPGSSVYFKGSIVSYSNEVKENLLSVKATTLRNFGAVSEESVHEMALGALKIMKTDYAIAVSGIAGPSGGTVDKPVGTVWIGIAKNEKVLTRKFLFPGNRERNMEMAAINGLSMLRKFMLSS